jgi:hypothetical protein
VIIDRLKYGRAPLQLGIHCRIYFSAAKFSRSTAEENVPAKINLADTSFALCVGIKVVMLYLSGMSWSSAFRIGKNGWALKSLYG